MWLFSDLKRTIWGWSRLLYRRVACRRRRPICRPASRAGRKAASRLLYPLDAKRHVMVTFILETCRSRNQTCSPLCASGHGKTSAAAIRTSVVMVLCGSCTGTGVTFAANQLVFVDVQGIRGRTSSPMHSRTNGHGNPKVRFTSYSSATGK